MVFIAYFCVSGPRVHWSLRPLTLKILSHTNQNVFLHIYCHFRPHRVNWLKVDDDVPSHAIIAGADLYIENLNKSYNGTYRCVASNSLGESYDDYILYVYGELT